MDGRRGKPWEVQEIPLEAPAAAAEPGPFSSPFHSISEFHQQFLKRFKVAICGGDHRTNPIVTNIYRQVMKRCRYGLGLQPDTSIHMHPYPPVGGDRPVQS